MITVGLEDLEADHKELERLKALEDDYFNTKWRLEAQAIKLEKVIDKAQDMYRFYFTLLILFICATLWHGYKAVTLECPQVEVINEKN